jgi:hypothetical protein
MTHSYRIGSLATAAAVALALAAAPDVSARASLVDSLVSQLGISKAQAAGGVQALLQTTKGKLSPTDYASLLQGSPELGELAKGLTATTGSAATATSSTTAATTAAAPKTSSSTSDLVAAATEAASSLGKSAGVDLSSLSQLTGLTSQFEKLGLDAGMVQKFVPVVLDYFSKSPGTASLLQKGLGLL